MAYEFEYGKMASKTLDIDLAGAVVLSNLANVSGTIPAYEGSFLTLGNLVADTTYSATGVEYDTYYAAAPAAVSDEVVVLDPSMVQEGVIGDNAYKMGIKQFNKQLSAGYVGRVRRLALHDKFWLGDSNFNAAPTVGQYGILVAGSTLLAPAANAGANFAVKVLLSKDLTAGMGTVGTQYLCEVVGL